MSSRLGGGVGSPEGRAGLRSGWTKGPNGGTGNEGHTVHFLPGAMVP